MSDSYPITYIDVRGDTLNCHYTVQYLDRHGRRNTIMLGKISKLKLFKGCDKLTARGLKVIKIIGLVHTGIVEESN